MKNSFSIDNYICTLWLRAFWSCVIITASLIGLHIVTSDATGNNYEMQKANQDFEIIFFTVTAIMEAIAVVFYIMLWCYQRGKEDLTGVNTCDCRQTCFFNFVRLGFTIALSIFVLVQADNFQKVGAIFHKESNSRNRRRYKQWDVIKTATVILMVLEIIQIVAIVCGLLYQPDDFQREYAFDSLNNMIEDGPQSKQNQSKGVIPEKDAIKVDRSNAAEEVAEEDRHSGPS